MILNITLDFTAIHQKTFPLNLKFDMPAFYAKYHG